MDERQRRIAENEVVFREVNERVRETQETYVIGSDEAEFVCECGDASCVERIRMSVKEYEELRSDPAHFAIRPGHEVDDVEVVVAHEGRFDVVRKRPGGPEEYAVARDPRS